MCVCIHVQQHITKVVAVCVCVCAVSTLSDVVINIVTKPLLEDFYLLAIYLASWKCLHFVWRGLGENEAAKYAKKAEGFCVRATNFFIPQSCFHVVSLNIKNHAARVGPTDERFPIWRNVGFSFSLSPHTHIHEWYVTRKGGFSGHFRRLTKKPLRNSELGFPTTNYI